MVAFLVILGIIAFLLMEHTIAFWCVFVPLAVLFVASLVIFLKKGGIRLGNFITAMVALAAMVVALLIVCIP